MAEITLRPLKDADRAWLVAFLQGHWGSTRAVSRGVIHDLVAYPGVVAEVEGEIAGLLTYHIAGDQCEITSLDSVRENAGVGSALIAAAKTAALEEACTRLWLITTNDNLRAIGFYQKRGFELVAIHRRALDESRKLKPQIPLIGQHGIPLRDEIEFEMRLE
jgi:ribosomal protein S18 acetylase RimI-like enzyme